MLLSVASIFANQMDTIIRMILKPTETLGKNVTLVPADVEHNT